MPRLTIIGGSGFLGRSLIPHCEGWSVTNLDRVPLSPDTPRPGDFREFVGDTVNTELLDRACEGADVIWIRAGLTGGAKSVDVSLLREYLLSNTEMVHSVLQAAQRADCRRILFDSSEQVWGISADLCSQEVGEEPTAGNFYGASKSISEKLLRRWSMAEGRSVQIFRYPRVRSATTRDVIFHMVKSCCEGRPVRVVVDPNHAIAFVHVDDVVQANLKALQLAPVFAIYQVSCDRPYTLVQIAETIKTLTASSSAILVEPSATGLPFEPLITGMPWQHSAERLGYVPKFALTSMIQETVAYVSGQMPGMA